MTTLVTAWIPTQRAPHATVRMIDEYVILARQVFSLGLPVIAFVHDSIHSKLENLARELGTDVTFIPTQTHSTSIERATALADLITRGQIPSVLTNPHRDTADYLCIQLSKADWILEATSHTTDEELWWIDLGLAHVAPIDRNQILEIPEGASALVALDERLATHIKSLSPGEQRNYELNWPTAAGGMFGVRSHFAREFSVLWWAAVDDYLRQNIAPTDELVLSDMAKHSPVITHVNGIHQNLFQSFARESDSQLQVTAKVDVERLASLMRLGELPTAHVTDLSDITPWDAGWSCFNPSIATDDRGTILCLVRSSNYTIDGYTYTIVDGSEVIKSQTKCLTLDSDFTVLDSFWIAEPEIITSEPLFPVHGIEDMRLSFDGNDWIVTGTIRQHDHEGYCRQIIGKLNLETHRLTDVHIMPTPITPWKTKAARVHEKNWLTIGARENRQELVWSTDPLVVLEWDWLTRNLSAKSGKPHVMNVLGLRGSTPFIETPIGQLGMVHEVSRTHTWPSQPSGAARRYVHRFVLIEQNSETPKFSEAFSFVGEQLEYAAGLALINERIVIAFGQNDETAHLLDIHLSEVEKLLHN